MYLAPGHAYIFFNYGAHFMLNVVSEPAGIAAAILIRALEPLEGIELMQRHRKTTRLVDLTRGPGRLAAAFQIDRSHDGLDLCATGSLWLGEIGHSAMPIGKTVRIGITRAADKLLRFYARGNPFVSGRDPQKIAYRVKVVRRGDCSPVPSPNPWYFPGVQTPSLPQEFSARDSPVSVNQSAVILFAISVFLFWDCFGELSP
jgi:hypothetical protein